MAAGTAARRGIDTLATVLRTVGMLVVAVLVVHIVLVLLEANPGNSFASTVANLADTLDLGLSNLFTYANAKLSTTLNYGVAAVIWYAATVVVVRLVRRLG